MWPFGKRIESVFRAFYFLVAKALIINYENRVRGKIEYISFTTLLLIKLVCAPHGMAQGTEKLL